MKQVALLHDTLEDCEDVTLDELSYLFGEKVSSMVDVLTNKRLSSEPKNEYLKEKMAKMDIKSLFVKLFDRLSNIRSNPSKKYLLDTIDLMSHLKTTRKNINPSYTIMDIIIKECQIQLVKG